MLSIVSGQHGHVVQISSDTRHMLNDIGGEKITHLEPALSTVWAIEAIYHYPSFVLFVEEFWTQELYTC
jgi:hypothetical protein